MSRYHSYLNSAVQVLGQYRGEEPFASFIKKYFSQYKKYGAADRRQISQLCYCSFRLGKALRQLAIEERIVTGLFLCSHEPNAILAALRPEWNEQTILPAEEKYSLLNIQHSMPGDLFPWQDALSKGIVYENLCSSFFIQPDLFLRLRPGKEKAVLKKLENSGVNFEQRTDTCIALPNASKIEQVIELNKEAVIQDYNSQRIGEFYRVAENGPGRKVWDCCAASGGKSMMAWDLPGDIDLTVSDIRESILVNLRKRFREAGITRYHSFCADLSLPGALPAGSAFDLVICDVPCTGSGTWGRTPEQLFYFEEHRTEEYAAKQKKIVANAIPYLHSGGTLVYSTCSVFKKENEDVVDFIAQQFGLTITRMETLQGYDKKADTLFAVSLTRGL